MGPERFRSDWRFAGCSAAALIMATTPVQAAPLSSAVVANLPLAVALGAAGFAVLAVLAYRRAVSDKRNAIEQGSRHIAALRAELDEYEALLSAAREVTVLWTEPGASPRVFGQTAELLPAGHRPEAMLDFGLWLDRPAVAPLTRAVEGLRTRGEDFVLDVAARDGRAIQIRGVPLGNGTALRIRPAASHAASRAPAAAQATATWLAALGLPAYRRDAAGAITYVNPLYEALAHPGRAADLDPLAGEARREHLAALFRGVPRTVAVIVAGHRLELTELPMADGSIGYLRPAAPPAAEPPAAAGDGRVSALLGALRIPSAYFDARHQLVAANQAYAELWHLGDSIRPGTDERTILDRLRREGQLPNEPDYRGWRARHLAAYQLAAPRTETWHLPDGRTLTVTAAPVGAEGGVVYLFDDVSQQLALVSQNRALASVQRSTLNALSDAVAVFGTNGRLQLFNPRLSALWQLPINFLEQNPHIDQIAAAAAAALPADGASIWADLKRAVIDLSPTRTDTKGRLVRSDGRLLDYAVVRLPDGQKLMTFLDVTESANYNRVLQERNDALVTADRLKDAFVQNVSYELRSPLTNIIGFADLLASPEVGPLNDRQRAYTDYIRTSSATLGVLIDNILDLATVDAGIAELRPEPQDVAALIDKASAGLATAFPRPGGGTTVNLKVSIPPDLPPLVADGTRIVQVLYNLLSVAARFSEPGGAITLTVAARGGRMLFTVEDEGTMSEETRVGLAHSDAAAGGLERGAGLGLSIVRAFVNLHGGTISVERRSPRGTRVVVNLPQDASAAATTAAE